MVILLAAMLALPGKPGHALLELEKDVDRAEAILASGHGSLERAAQLETSTDDMAAEVMIKLCDEIPTVEDWGTWVKDENTFASKLQELETKAAVAGGVAHDELDVVDHAVVGAALQVDGRLDDGRPPVRADHEDL